MALRALRPKSDTPTTQAQPANDEVAALKAKLAALEAQAQAKPAEPQAEPQAVAQPSGASPLAVLFGQAGLPVAAAGGVQALVQSRDTGGSPLVYPVIEVTPGNTGGIFSPSQRNPEDLAAILPSGRQPLHAVFLGYRYEVVAWKRGFSDSQGEEDNTPAWGCVVPCTETEKVKQLVAFAEAYQYTPTSARDVFDYPDGPGHIRPVFQLLTYLAPVGKWSGGLVVVQSPWHTTSVTRSAESLLRHADPNTGVIPPFACSVAVHTTTETNKAGTYQWKIHSLAVQALPFPGQAAEQVYVAFKEWFQSLTQEDKEEFQNWVKGEDRPITTEAAEALAKGAKLRRR